MKPVRVDREARTELDHEIDWYEKRHSGLGLALLSEFEDIVRQIGLDPQTGAQYENRNYHFIRMRRFPFAVYFQELTDSVWIAAVAHHKRRPGYWLSRKPDG
jgi:hypothetical protein